MVLAMNDNRYKERGRPRAFDTDSALDSAMLVFRQKGYHATSIGDLGQAMQLTTGSIYKAFTDKRTLFANVFARYLSMRNSSLAARWRNVKMAVSNWRRYSIFMWIQCAMSKVSAAVWWLSAPWSCKLWMRNLPEPSARR